MKKKEEPIINQPTDEQQREYASLADNMPSIVPILGTSKTYKIGWLRNAQLIKLARLMLHIDKNGNTEKEPSLWQEFVDDNKLASKAAAIYILDGYIKVKLFYGILWRWFYYVKQYTNAQLQPILDEGKKKVPLTQFYVTTMSLTEAKDTLMNMRTKEAERILRELSTAQQSQAVKSDNGSQPQDTSSSDS